MSDPQDRSGNPPVDSDAFQEWVTHTADARNIDEEDLLNQLVSAFWVLDEMNGLMIDDDPFGSATGSSPPRSATDTRSSTGTQDGPSNNDSADMGPQSDADTAEDSETAGIDDHDQSSPSLDEATTQEIRDLRQSLHTQLEMVQAVGELRRQVSDLSLDVEQQRSRHDNFTDRISDDLTRLYSQIEAIDSPENDSLNDELLSRLQRIDSRIEELDSQIDDIDARNDGADTTIENLESTYQEFETWVDREFDEIEQLFNQIIGTTDELETRVEAIEENIHGLTDGDEMEKQLAQLRRDALRSGVDSGRCETCDTVVDIPLLNEPVCPSCDTEFSGVESTGSPWNPFSKPTIRTESTSSDRSL